MDKLLFNSFEKHSLPIWTHEELENLYSSISLKEIESVIKGHAIKGSIIIFIPLASPHTNTACKKNLKGKSIDFN